MSDELTPEAIDGELARLYTEMIDLNADAMKAMRQQMKNVETIRQAFLIQADRANEVIQFLAAGAALVAKTTGDLILSEYGSEKDDSNDEDDDDDDSEE